MAFPLRSINKPPPTTLNRHPTARGYHLAHNELSHSCANSCPLLSSNQLDANDVGIYSKGAWYQAWSSALLTKTETAAAQSPAASINHPSRRLNTLRHG